MSRGRARAAVLVAWLLSWSAPARAEQPTVLVVRPRAEGSAVETLVNLARGELTADGFEVLVVSHVERERRGELLAEQAQTRHVALSIGLFLSDDGATLELWCLEVATGKLTVESVDARLGSSEVDPKVVARRTVDQVRAKLLRPFVERMTPPSTSKPARSSDRRSTAPVPPAPRPPSSSSGGPASFGAGMGAGIGVGMGVGLLTSLRDFGVVALPLLRAHYAPLPWLQLRGTAAGFGSHATFHAPAGEVTVDQALGLLEAVASPWSRQRVRPRVSVGTGAHYVRVDGAAAPPFQGRSEVSWTMAFDAGVGAATDLTSHIDLTLEGHLLLTTPGVAVRIHDVDAARLGLPSGFVTLTLSWERR